MYSIRVAVFLETFFLHYPLSVLSLPPPFVYSSVSGVAILACLHCTFHPAVKDYLMRRYDNVAKTEVPPTCSVATGLLVALHYSANG